MKKVLVLVAAVLLALISVFSGVVSLGYITIEQPAPVIEGVEGTGEVVAVPVFDLLSGLTSSWAADVILVSVMVVGAFGAGILLVVGVKLKKRVVSKPKKITVVPVPDATSITVVKSTIPLSSAVVSGKPIPAARAKNSTGTNVKF